MLKEEFLEPLELTQAELSRRMGVTTRVVNEISQGKRAITPCTAILLSDMLVTQPDFWLNCQLNGDLWHEYKRIKRKIA
jgi:addiction module HigA family antidote